MMRRLRILCRLAGIALSVMIGVPMHVLTQRVRGRSQWPRRLLQGVTRASGVRLMVEGVPPPAGGLIVANHRSWLDIAVIAAASGCTFVSKAEIGRWRMIGAMARMNDTVLIERTKRSDVRNQADTLRQALQLPKPIALFPEGTTNNGPGIMPFRASLFGAVDPPSPGVLVWPALIDYGASEPFVTWPEEEGAWANLIRILGRRGKMPVSVRFLPSIDPADFPGRKATALAAQHALETAAGLR